MKPVPVVTLDGPGGAGKGTVAVRLAQALGWHLLDSGALYRAVALSARRQAIALDAEAHLVELVGDLRLRFEVVEPDRVEVWLNGHCVDTDIRSEDTAASASRVAVLPAVRRALLSMQRSFRRAPGLVADGRDMGTVVFPDAECKIYLTASADERASRRYKQLKGKGVGVNLDQLCRDIRARDRRDAERATAPLKPAPDAVIVDTTELGIEQSIKKVKRIVAKKLNLTKL